MGGGLSERLIQPNPFRDMEFNQAFGCARKTTFIFSPPLQTRYVFPSRVAKKMTTKMSWVIPTISSQGQNASRLLGLTQFSRKSREKPIRSVKVRAGLAGSNSVSEMTNRRSRVTRISKWAVVIVIALSCTASVFRCRAVYAAESVAALMPQLSVKLRALFLGFLPKVGQVLSVFRDQGLLISALLGLSAFFSMAETSIMTLWPWKVDIVGCI
eukprot:Gb_17632 [translate_table: standard]